MKFKVGTFVKEETVLAHFIRFENGLTLTTTEKLPFVGKTKREEVKAKLNEIVNHLVKSGFTKE